VQSARWRAVAACFVPGHGIPTAARPAGPGSGWLTGRTRSGLASDVELAQLEAALVVFTPAFARAFALAWLRGHHFQHPLVSAWRAGRAQVDDQGPIRGLDAGRHDEYGGVRIFLVARQLVRDERLLVERPQELVQRVGLVGIAGQDQGGSLGDEC